MGDAVATELIGELATDRASDCPQQWPDEGVVDDVDFRELGLGQQGETGGEADKRAEGRQINQAGDPGIFFPQDDEL